MRIIHCTKKLLKELDVSLVEPDKIPQPTEGLGNWYANLLRIDRRKCLLFTNEKSLYTFLIPKVLKANLKNIEEEFLIHLSYNLQNEGFGLEVINKIMQEYQEIGFAKTSNRQVLGSMNEFAFQYEVLIEQKEGLENIRILELNKHINRTIMGALKYKYPIEALRNLLKSH
ncbi:MAG: hypothetical protein COY75_09510 [Nitrospirae bacterium CG_4_10_14_0_8_um_filter_41_23]|nr:hypothetical protein [Nitrospirota bacterium]OIP59745.1 MAG: hypothetical protein AUK38_04830 [Nitrospirae bacterium CG2_30_41_42]PIQ93711.1 MAG: hypothetical protein COV68_08480 [Nitrospirae bacterium CG11_big_fil_rev_8_21_14_0_20_41_14]PIV42207.1 MAG: hypothetical protein COS27_07750 [Nitrospirae bacterium CG02_land_8_20_14_3_00_41_53]PIW87937.1 MAG: hypothetical protein COZ94_02385 [Nitrospirae bacterium CG_4_8_14_3_um_filter_41_47]PIY86160.1 MAG: hypothetical protein COY75_09510 [Nitros